MTWSYSFTDIRNEDWLIEKVQKRLKEELDKLQVQMNDGEDESGRPQRRGLFQLSWGLTFGSTRTVKGRPMSARRRGRRNA